MERIRNLGGILCLWSEHLPGHHVFTIVPMKGTVPEEAIMKRILRLSTAVVFMSAVWLMVFQAASAVRAEDAPLVIQSAGEECISAEYLAGWMGLKTATQNGGSTVLLRQGGKTLTLDSGSVVATDGNSEFLLPTCPIRKDSGFFVPVRAVLHAFGGTAVDTPDGLRMEYRGKTTLLPKPADLSAPSGLDRVRLDIDDPRIPLPEMVKSSIKTSRIWVYLDDFNKAAARVQPTVRMISNSLALRIIGKIPVVGTPASVAQSTAQCINTSLTASAFLAKTHRETAEPVRKAVLAVDRVKKSPSAESLKSALPLWEAAQTAVDKQIAQSDKTIATVRRMSATVKSLDKKVRERLGSKGSADSTAIRTFSSATDRYVLRLQGSKWELSALKSYFKNLADDGRNIGG